MWSSRLRTFLKMHPVLREIRVKKEKSQAGAMLDFFSVSRRRKMVFAGNEKSHCRLDILVDFLTAAL